MRKVRQKSRNSSGLFYLPYSEFHSRAPTQIYNLIFDCASFFLFIFLAYTLPT